MMDVLGMWRATYRDRDDVWWLIEGSESFEWEHALGIAQDFAFLHGLPTALEVFEVPDPTEPSEGTEPAWFVDQSFVPGSVYRPSSEMVDG